MIMRNKETSRSKKKLMVLKESHMDSNCDKQRTLVETAQQVVLVLVTVTVTKYLKLSA